MVDLAAEGAVGACVRAYPQDHISIDVLNLWTFSHAFSSCIVSKRPGFALLDAGIGAVVSPGSLAAVSLASACPGVTVLGVNAGVAASGKTGAIGGIGEGVGCDAVKDADVVVSIVIRQ